MRVDYHIHSLHSPDSKQLIQPLVEKAIQLQYNEIAFTDHYDLLPSEIRRFGVPAYIVNRNEILSYKEQYPLLRILHGVEIGEYHRCKSMVDEIIGQDVPDLKIASIHVLPDGKNISVPFQPLLTKEETASYYLENLKLVNLTDFHVLGHLGIHKRYFAIDRDSKELNPILKDIFQAMKDKRMALEVNYSGLRKTRHSILPSRDHLEQFMIEGSGILTIGSDSHTIDDFDDHYDDAIILLRSWGIRSLSSRETNEWVDFSI